MNTTQDIPTVPGTPFGGGFYAGRINIDGKLYALILAPKQSLVDTHQWNKSLDAVPGAMSFFDGHANTCAMAEAGSTLAQKALSLDVGGHRDWYLPSRDELELCYRNLKPSAGENHVWRSGDNPSSVPPGYPYAENLPAQTAAEAFQDDGSEAFDLDGYYWTSSQYAGYSSFAWIQDFEGGDQLLNHKTIECRARAVRRLVIQ